MQTARGVEEQLSEEQQVHCPVTIETGDVWRCCNLIHLKVPDLSDDQIVLEDLSRQITLCFHALCQLVGYTRWGQRIGGGGRWVPEICNTMQICWCPMALGYGIWTACAPPSYQAQWEKAGQLACKTVRKKEATDPPPRMQEGIRASVLAWIGFVGV